MNKVKIISEFERNIRNVASFKWFFNIFLLLLEAIFTVYLATLNFLRMNAAFMIHIQHGIVHNIPDLSIIKNSRILTYLNILNDTTVRDKRTTYVSFYII